MKANRYHFRHTSRSSTGWPGIGHVVPRGYCGPNRRPCRACRGGGFELFARPFKDCAKCSGSGFAPAVGRWSGSVRLAIFGVVLLFVCGYAVYHALSTEPPAPVQAPALPQIEFRSTQPIRERLDPQNSA